MNKKFRWFLVPAAAIGLSACTAIVIDSYPRSPIGYSGGDFEFATPNGAIVTEVLGNPFSGQQNVFANRVRSLLKNQVGDFPTTFVSKPGANTTPPYRIIVVFNPRGNASYNAICEDANQTPDTTKGKGTLSVSMVFCDGQKLKTGTRGRVSGVDSPNDPQFTALVQQVANTLIPPFGQQRQQQNGDNE